MGNRFASGKNAISECDRCDFRYPLKVLRREVIKGRNYELLVCPTCWDPDQPQLHLGEFPVDDPQGLRNPRPDRSYYASGTTGLQIDVYTPGDYTLNGQGYTAGGSRDTQWGWNPIGGSQLFDNALTPNYLTTATAVGTVSIATT